MAGHLGPFGEECGFGICGAERAIGPVLMSLDVIVESYLTLKERSRHLLHRNIYTWTFAIISYKARRLGSGIGLDRRTVPLPGQPGMTLGGFACLFTGTIHGTLSVVLAVTVGTEVTEELNLGRQLGPLRVLLVLCAALATGAACL